MMGCNFSTVRYLEVPMCGRLALASALSKERFGREWVPSSPTLSSSSSTSSMLFMLIRVDEPTVTVTLGGDDASLRLLFRPPLSIPT